MKANLIETDKGNKLLEAALSYAKKGWSVLPLHYPTSNGCSCLNKTCGSNGKHPLVKNGVKAASSDSNQIEKWWNQWPQANIGIATGSKSELLVVDVDDRHGGESSLEELKESHELDGAVISYTGNGQHLYFQYSQKRTVQNRVNFIQGIDIRGENGYVVAAPSAHHSGRKYVWDVDTHPCDQELSAPPTSLLRELLSKPKKEGPSPTDSEISIPSGERNKSLARIGGYLRRGGLDQGAILAALKEINSVKCNPPLEVSEVSAIAKSVSRYSPSKQPVFRAEDNVTPIRVESQVPKKLTAGINATKSGYFVVSESGEYEKLLSNFTLELERTVRYEKKWGEVEYYREFKVLRGLKPVAKVEIAPPILLDVQKFSAALAAQGPYIWLGSSNDLKRLMLQILSEESQESTVHKVLMTGYHTERKVWVFQNSYVDKAGRWKSGSCGIQPLPLDRSNETGLPFLHEPLEPKAIKRFLGLLFKNLGNPALLAFGWFAAIPYLPALEKAIVPAQFPLLFLYGRSKSGKSLLASWLLRIFGVTSSTDIGNTSSAYLQRLLSYHSCLPTFLNEFQNSQHTKALETLLLNAYDRTGVAKAERDSSHVRSLPVRSAVLLAGEHLPDRPSLLNRCITVRLMASARRDEVRGEIETIVPTLPGLGSYLIFQSQQPERAHSFVENVKKIQAEIVSFTFDQRLSYNFAVALAGVSEWLDEGSKKALWEEVKDLLKGYCVDQDEHSYVSEFIRDLYQMRIQAKENEPIKQLLSAALEIRPTESYINIPMIYPVWEEQLRKRGRSPNLSQRDLRKYLLEESEWAKEGRKHINSRFIRVVVLIHANMPAELQSIWVDQ